MYIELPKQAAVQMFKDKETFPVLPFRTLPYFSNIFLWCSRWTWTHYINSRCNRTKHRGCIFCSTPHWFHRGRTNSPCRRLTVPDHPTLTLTLFKSYCFPFLDPYMHSHIRLKWNAKFPFMQNIKCSWWVAHPALFHILAILSQFSGAREHVSSKALITGIRTRSTPEQYPVKIQGLIIIQCSQLISWDLQQLGKCFINQ